MAFFFFLSLNDCGRGLVVLRGTGWMLARRSLYCNGMSVDFAMLTPLLLLDLSRLDRVSFRKVGFFGVEAFSRVHRTGLRRKSALSVGMGIVWRLILLSLPYCHVIGGWLLYLWGVGHINIGG